MNEKTYYKSYRSACLEWPLRLRHTRVTTVDAMMRRTPEPAAVIRNDSEKYMCQLWKGLNEQNVATDNQTYLISRPKVCPIPLCASLLVDRHPSNSRILWLRPPRQGRWDLILQDEGRRLLNLFFVYVNPCTAWQLILRLHKPYKNRFIWKHFRKGRWPSQRVSPHQSFPCDKRANERGCRFVRTERFVVNGMTDKCGGDGWVKADREQLAATIHWL